ncbi:MAG: hypothetical protein HOQ05_07890 [Corynebacteriales bacterium]|nr:hypothetical protein [Mycobacteriales bacterium]
MPNSSDAEPEDHPVTDAEETANPMPTLLGHLSFGLAALTVTAFAGALIAAKVASAPVGIGFAVGCGIVWFFFSLSSFLIAWADMVNRELIMPIGLGAYLLKICLVGFLVFAISEADWNGFPGLVWGLIVGTGVWMMALIGWGLWQSGRQEIPDESAEIAAEETPKKGDDK